MSRIMHLMERFIVRYVDKTVCHGIMYLHYRSSVIWNLYGFTLNNYLKINQTVTTFWRVAH